MEILGVLMGFLESMWGFHVSTEGFRVSRGGFWGPLSFENSTSWFLVKLAE